MAVDKWIQISPDDNVVVALQVLEAGEQVDDVKTLSEIPFGHKVALRTIAEGQKILKYGYPIGVATETIPAGAHVHTNNTRTLLDETVEYRYQPVPPPVLATGLEKATFSGYRRADGKVGTRNEIWIINTVGCVNRTAERIVQVASLAYEGKTDGIFTFVHPYGCSQLGQDHDSTRQILLDLVKHPNAGGVLVLGLGCENNQVDAFKEALGEFDESRVKFLISQDVEDEIETGVEMVAQLVNVVSQDQREDCPVSELVVGMKCGGSDGLSGVTANPLVGAFSDRLVAAGGTSILTEVPEMFGAETILMNRCRDHATFERVVKLIDDFKAYFKRYGQTVYENPSPGNKDGGITTLEDKSLGCIQKGGRAVIEQVLDYGGIVSQKGLVLLNGPGNDIVSTTALTAAGATLIFFTTGRGTPLGAPVPTVKIASNTPLALRKHNWIDFNAGALLDDGVTLPSLTDRFCNDVLAIASGKQCRNEANGYREIAIFKDGVTL